jgi:hypothetical protein
MGCPSDTELLLQISGNAVVYSKKNASQDRSLWFRQYGADGRQCTFFEGEQSCIDRVALAVGQELDLWASEDGVDAAMGKIVPIGEVLEFRWRLQQARDLQFVAVSISRIAAGLNEYRPLNVFPLIFHVYLLCIHTEVGPPIADIGFGHHHASDGRPSGVVVMGEGMVIELGDTGVEPQSAEEQGETTSTGQADTLFSPPEDDDGGGQYRCQPDQFCSHLKYGSQVNAQEPGTAEIEKGHLSCLSMVGEAMIGLTGWVWN